MHRLDIPAIRGQFPVLQRRIRGKPLVYLDSAATSQKPRAMVERITRLYAHDYARAEEGHALSRDATAAFEGVRARVAHLVHAADPREIVFCRGATEALNLLAWSFTRGLLHPGDEVLVTEMEHHSNIVPWLLACQQTGATLRAMPVLATGDLDLDALEGMLTPRVRVLAVTHVSNVTGALVPVKRVTALAHARGIPVVVDGAQAVPHIPVDVRDIGCEFYAGSGHKMGGPSSVGFLYGQAARLELLPLADGGSVMAESVSFEDVTPAPIPHRFEAGEPEFGEAVAWGPAIEYWTHIGLDQIAAYEMDLTTHAVQRLRAIPRVKILGQPADRISIVSFTVDGMPANDVAQALDAEAIAVRAGKQAAQPLLKKLGVDEAVRASFSFYNTHHEVDFFADVLERIVGAPASRSRESASMAAASKP